MKWEVVRKIYPNRFVKLRVLESHIKANIKYIDDMAVIEALADNVEATRKLARAKDDILIYHTDNEKIKVEIKQIFGYRGAI